MRRSTRVNFFVGIGFAAAAFVAAGPVWAQVAGQNNQPGDPLGGVGIDGTTTGDSEFKLRGAGEIFHDVTRLPAGDLLVLYSPQGGGSLLIQRHAPSGEAAGDPIIVADQNATLPHIASSADGGFVATWEQRNDRDGDGSFDRDVYTRAFDAAGEPLSAVRQVNDYTPDNQFAPDIAMDADGDYVVVWQSTGQDGDVVIDEASGTERPATDIYARRYDTAGAPVGEAFRVNTDQQGDQRKATVGANAGGAFVVSFLDNGALRFRRFAADGSPRGPQSDDVLTPDAIGNPDSPNTPDDPVIAVAPSGAFGIAWSNESGEESNRGIRFRRFSADAEPLDHTSMTVSGPNIFAIDLSVDYDGDYVAAWSAYGEMTIEGPGFSFTVPDYSVSTVFGRLIETGSDALTGDDGVAVSDESLAGLQEDSRVAMDADGDFVVVWESSDTTADGNGNTPDDGVFAQRFVGPEPVDLSATLTVSPGRVQSNGSVTYTATVTNTHDPVAPTGVEPIDSAIGLAAGLSTSIALPSGAVAGSVDSEDWICPAAGGGGTVVCSFQGELAAGADSMFQLPTTAPPSDGDASAMLTAASAQFDPDAGDDDGNNVDQVGLTVGTGGNDDNDDGYDGVGGDDGFPVQGQDNFDGGGCAMGDGRGPFDPLFPTLMLVAGLVLIRRRASARPLYRARSVPVGTRY